MTVGPAPLIAVVGATATGKSDVAAALAQSFGGEVVGADSRQVYTGMAIGTAQPSAELRASVPHHLIAYLPPDAPFGLARYLDDARAVLAVLRSRGRLPIVAGGTGQYVWALLESWNVPKVAPAPALRARLEAFAVEQGAAALYARLLAADPDAAALIHPNNLRRTIRALEVLEQTGVPFSTLRGKGDAEPAIVLGLRLPRELLQARIDRRVEQMYASGLLAEVLALRALGYAANLPSQSSIGYPEAWSVIAGTLNAIEAVRATQQATRRLARQQEKWFRVADPRICWIEAGDGAAERAVAAVTERLRRC